jgi:hypothetical protein
MCGARVPRPAAWPMRCTRTWRTRLRLVFVEEVGGPGRAGSAFCGAGVACFCQGARGSGRRTAAASGVRGAAHDRLSPVAIDPMPDLRANLRFVAKVVLATLLLGALAGVAGSQIVPGWSLARGAAEQRIGRGGAGGRAGHVAAIAWLALGQFILRKGGTDVQWLWFPWRSAGSGGLAPPGARPEKDPAGPTALSVKLTARCLARDGRSFLVEKWTKIALTHGPLKFQVQHPISELEVQHEGRSEIRTLEL